MRVILLIFQQSCNWQLMQKTSCTWKDRQIRFRAHTNVLQPSAIMQGRNLKRVMGQPRQKLCPRLSAATDYSHHALMPPTTATPVSNQLRYIAATNYSKLAIKCLLQAVLPLQLV